MSCAAGGACSSSPVTEPVTEQQEDVLCILVEVQVERGLRIDEAVFKNAVEPASTFATAECRQ